MFKHYIANSDKVIKGLSKYPKRLPNSELLKSMKASTNTEIFSKVKNLTFLSKIRDGDYKRNGTETTIWSTITTQPSQVLLWNGNDND